jgi:ribosomal protein L16 Arg81 hydroxylase
MVERPALDLEWLLFPVKTDTFFADHMEKKLLLVHGPDATKFNGVLRVENLDVFLWQQEEQLRSIISVFKENREIHPDKYVSKAHHRRWLLGAYQSGGTLVVNHLDKICLPVAQLKRSLVDRFMGAVSVNAYITPPSAIGFSAHYDRHDVFILQIAGSKAWTVGRAPEIQLPNERQARLQGTPLKSLKRNAMRITLSRGDLLYIPRGIVHKAETTKEYSIHLTIGVTPCNWGQIAGAMIQACEDGDVSLRKAAWASDGAPGFVNDLNQLIRSHLRIHDAVGDAFKHVKRELVTRMSALPDDSVDIFASELLGSDTFLQLRSGMQCAVSTKDQKVEITFPGLGSESRPASIEGPS